jgi:cation diffusion facilitator family transporter
MTDASTKVRRRAARLSVFSNTGLVVVKVAAGLTSGSISVLAEGIQSTVDIFASLMIYVSLGVAGRPPDRRHPYGHGKVESLTSAVQMLLILGSTAFILFQAYRRLLSPRMPDVDWGIGAMGVALVVDLAVSSYLQRVARQTGSLALEAEAQHLRSDMYACAGVLLGLVAVRLTGWAPLDPIIAALLALVVIITAIRLMGVSLRPLLDQSLPAEEEAQIRRALDTDDRVMGYHKLRTRQAGSQRHVDVHVMLEDSLRLSEGHAIGEEIEQAIRQTLPNLDVVVHVEPYAEEISHQAMQHGILDPNEKAHRSPDGSRREQPGQMKTVSDPPKFDRRDCGKKHRGEEG